MPCKPAVYSVIVCIRDHELFGRVLQSSLPVGDEAVELIAIDNAQNQYTLPQALNLGAAQASGDILVFLHQDVRLPPAWFDRLRDQTRTIESSWGDWGVLGVFGVTRSGRMVGHIDDPHGYRKRGRLPCRVQSLDEVCLVVKRKDGLRFDEQLGGYHMYGADLCLQARQRGAACFVVDACLEHLSGGTIDDDFLETARRFESKWQHTRGSPFVTETTCGVFRTRPGRAAARATTLCQLRRGVWERLQR